MLADAISQGPVSPLANPSQIWGYWTVDWSRAAKATLGQCLGGTLCLNHFLKCRPFLSLFSFCLIFILLFGFFSRPIRLVLPFHLLLFPYKIVCLLNLFPEKSSICLVSVWQASKPAPLHLQPLVKWENIFLSCALQHRNMW